MTRRNAAIFATILTGLALAGPASAHHSFGMYDNTVYTKLSGTVKSFLWANPHSMVDFMVKGADGKVEAWTAECSPINMIGRRGWASDSLKPGDNVQFVIHPNKAGARYGLLVSATKSDGAVLKDKD